jgi:hypothetical protein
MLLGLYFRDAFPPMLYKFTHSLYNSTMIELIRLAGPEV